MAPNNRPDAVEDKLEGQEINILNEMLAALHPKAKGGDEQAIDRVIKIIALKRQIRADDRGEADW